MHKWWMGPLRDEADEGSGGGGDGSGGGIDVDALRAEFKANHDELAASNRRQLSDVKKTNDELKAALDELRESRSGDGDEGGNEDDPDGKTPDDPKANAEVAKMRRDFEKGQKDLAKMREDLSARDEKIERASREGAISKAIEGTAKDLELISNGKRFAFKDIEDKVVREDPADPESRLLYKTDDGSVPLVDGVKAWFEEFGPDITLPSGNGGTGHRGSSGDTSALPTDLANLPKEKRAEALKAYSQLL